jgi:hypothetical protein
MWLAYIHFEKQYGDAKRCDSIFKQAIGRKTDAPEALFEEWLAFHRRYDGVKEYYDALAKIKKHQRFLHKVYEKELERAQTMAVLEVQEEKQFLKRKSEETAKETEEPVKKIKAEQKEEPKKVMQEFKIIEE